MMIVYIMTRLSLEGPARKAINKNKRLSLQRTAPYCPPTPRSRFLVDGDVDGDDRGGHVVVGEDFAGHVVGGEDFADHVVVGEDFADHVVVGEDFADHVVVGEDFADHVVGGEDFADYRDQEETIANAEHHLSSPSTKSTLCIPHPPIPR